MGQDRDDCVGGLVMFAATGRGVEADDGVEGESANVTTSYSTGTFLALFDENAPLVALSMYCGPKSTLSPQTLLSLYLY